MPHLDGRTLQIPLTEVVQPGTVKVLAREGMPSSKTGARGDLRVTLDVELPWSLSPAAKQQLKNILPAQ